MAFVGDFLIAAIHESSLLLSTFALSAPCFINPNVAAMLCCQLVGGMSFHAFLICAPHGHVLAHAMCSIAANFSYQALPYQPFSYQPE